VLDGGHHGTSSVGITAGGSQNYIAQALIGAGGAGLIIVTLGTNDVILPTAPADFATNVATIIAAHRTAGFDGSVLYLAPYKGGGRADAVWDPYVVALQGIADADPDGVFLDLGSRMPDAPNANFATSAMGLFFDG